MHHQQNTKLCQYYMRGKCKFGHKCFNSHHVLKTYLIRHAQSNFNKASEYFDGDILSEEAKQAFQLNRSLMDSPLSPEGIQQIKFIKLPEEIVVHQQKLVIFVSPLQRTLSTVENMLKIHKLKCWTVIVLPGLSEVLSKVCDFSLGIKEKKEKYPNFDFTYMMGENSERWQDQFVDDYLKQMIKKDSKNGNRYMQILEEIFPKPLQGSKRCFNRTMKALQFIRNLCMKSNIHYSLIVSHNRVLKYMMGKDTEGKAESFENCQIKQLYF